MNFQKAAYKLKTWRSTAWMFATRRSATVPRILSWLLSIYSYKLAKEKPLAGPAKLDIEVTNSCNLLCSICPTGVKNLGRDKAVLDSDGFKKIVDELSGSLMTIQFAGYGEPFLNAQVFDMLAYARRRKVFSEVYSNLLLLDDDKLRRIVDTPVDKLIVAVDLAPEGQNWRFTHATARDIDRVKERLKRLAEIKAERKSSLPDVWVSYPVTKANIHLMPQAKALAKEVDARLLLKTVNATVAGKGLKEMRESYVPEEFDRYTRPRMGSGFCAWPYHAALVFANGDVSPCCFLGRGEIVLGNVFKEGGFEKVWNGENYRRFRRQMKTDPGSMPICGDCTERFQPI